MLQEAKEIAKLSGPVFIANVCGMFGLQVTDTIFLGHLGDTELAAASLGNTWTFCTGMLAVGLSMGMDTLVSQAYGAKNYKLVGIIFQNCMLLMTLVCIPVGMMWFWTEEVLILMGQDPALAQLSGVFSKYLLIGLVPQVWFQGLSRYLINQGIVLPSTIIGIVVFFLNILFNYLFIYGLDLGFIGSPLATAMSRVLSMILLWLYMYLKKLHHKTWFGWSKEMFDSKRLLTYFKFGCQGGLMITFEVWGFELCTLAVGLLHSAVFLSTHTISFNFLLLCFVVPISLSVGVSTRVGNLLGEGRFLVAKSAALASVILTSMIILLNSSLLLAARKSLAYIYTDDQEVIDLVPQLLLIASLASSFDGWQTIMGGLLRGAGKPLRGTIANFAGYYVISLPLYFVFGFALDWKVMGIWGGLASGLFIVAVANTILVLQINWEKESEAAQKRSEKQTEEQLPFIKDDNATVEMDKIVVE